MLVTNSEQRMICRSRKNSEATLLPSPSRTISKNLSLLDEALEEASPFKERGAFIADLSSNCKNEQLGFVGRSRAPKAV